MTGSQCVRVNTDPATAQTITLPDGAQIGIATYGDPQGRPLLFLHGWPGSRLQGEMADTAARALGWQLIAPDRPGIGLSDCPEPFTLIGWAERVRQLLDRLGWDRCHLMAISGGAPGALACAHAFPDRIVAMGIACGAVPMAEVPSLDGLFPLFRMLLRLDQRVPGFSPFLLRTMQTYLRALPPSAAMQPNRLLLRGADRRLFADPSLRRTIGLSLREAYRRGPQGVLKDGRSIARPWGFDWRQTPASVPLKFWHGDADGTIPLAMAQWAVNEMGLSNRLEIFPGEGHFSLPILNGRRLLEDLGKVWRS